MVIAALKLKDAYTLEGKLKQVYNLCQKGNQSYNEKEKGVNPVNKKRCSNNISYYEMTVIGKKENS